MDSKQLAATLKTAQHHLYSGAFGPAQEALCSILEAHPTHSEALYMRVVCFRYENKLQEAFEALYTLKNHEPEFGRAHQEEGHLHLASGKSAQALASFRTAVQVNPALEASWRKIAELQKLAGNLTEAQDALAQADRLKALPPALQAANHHLFEGRLLKAETLCRTFLQAHPRHIEGMRILADIGAKLGSLEDAEFILESALTFAPENIQVRLDYIAVLRKRQKFMAALSQAKQLLDTDPENPVFLSHYAIECLQANKLEDALATFDKVLEKLPADPATLTSRGHVLKTLGQQADAVASYQAAIQAEPNHGDAYYGLANLKTYTFSDDEIESLEHALGSETLSFPARIQMEFSLAKAYEDATDYARAFDHYQTGNALKKKQCRYNADQMDAEFVATKQACSADLFKHQKGGCTAPDPIFIVGLPRAGSTLLEQILASHSQVDGTLELPNIIAMVQKLRGGRPINDPKGYPGCLSTLSQEDRRALGEAYIRDTQLHRKGAPFFIDKMPNNFRHIGLIHLILPNAKIIDARRDPMACCFSGFKQLFAEGQEFTYGLEEIGRYYSGYVNLMNHWDTVLPDKVLRVQYEDVVADLEAQVRRILDFCDLPFEEACLNFHKTDRAVRTASSEQVRQPIYKSGLAQWQHFEPYLDPLKNALGDLLD